MGNRVEVGNTVFEEQEEVHGLGSGPAPWLRERMVRKVKARNAKLGKPWEIWIDSKEQCASVKGGRSNLS